MRLASGDVQVDASYHSGDAHSRHHVMEVFSESSYHVYMARLAPIDSIKKVVRSNFVLKEYAKSICHLNETSPDECIPKFFLASDIFSSHLDMDLLDLEVSESCGYVQNFLK